MGISVPTDRQGGQGEVSGGKKKIPFQKDFFS